MKFVLIPWINWDSYLYSRPHQLVREALRRGHRVLYINPGTGSALTDGNLEVWHPLAHPFFETIRKILRGELFRRNGIESNGKLTPMRRWVYRPYEEVNRSTFLSKLMVEFLTKWKLRTFRDWEDRNIIFFEQPFPFVYQVPHLKGLGYTIVYDLIDDWSAYQDSPAYFRQTEPYLLENADIVTATSKSLFDKAIRYNRNTHLCPNAADLNHFSTGRKGWEMPPDLPDGKRIAGFFGIIREWFDIGLVRDTALRKPQVEFCLIGEYSEAAFEALKDLRNVHFLGHKDYSVLPRYLHFFDVALIPFVINELIRSTNPIKVYEYLAGGKPVVATNIPEIESMPSVYLSKNKEEFIRNLDLAIETTPDFKEIDAFLANHTWAKRFDVIEKTIRTI